MSGRPLHRPGVIESCATIFAVAGGLASEYGGAM